MKRDFISIDDVSNAALHRLMEAADRIRDDLRSHMSDLAGYLMGSLFLEPSTRTRLSFEAAMARLGGRVITSSDPLSSSSSKGETLSDTVRIVDSYVDVTVLRHPMAGAARLAARHAEHPIINAGDGAHEHPTQTLCDLYALRCERGALENLLVVLYGDLKFGRTVHSLSKALVRMGATVLAIAEDRLGLPEAL
ncbi:MAG TPA: aspartate carbamoyltransferase, partial [Planctomycetota bacterium]|nr:aspartate carbamoyltransferase [Planctomycetota bacterium]